MSLQKPKSSCVQLAAAIAATLLLTSQAHADVEAGKLTLSGYIDAAAGAQLFAGNYSAVIDKLAPHSASFALDQVAASTNLCVAYVATGKLAEAQGACDEAIKMASMDRSGMTLADHLAHQDAVALAHANRAVLTKLSGE